MLSQKPLVFFPFLSRLIERSSVRILNGIARWLILPLREEEFPLSNAECRPHVLIYPVKKVSIRRCLVRKSSKWISRLRELSALHWGTTLKRYASH
jgi:hypothetical protein